MKTFGIYLKRYYAEEWQPNRRAYLWPLLFICALTTVEYTVGFEQFFLKEQSDFWARFGLQWLYLVLVWSLPLFWISRKRSKPLVWKPWLPWLLLVFVVFAFRSSFRGHLNWMIDAGTRWDLNTYYFYWFTAAQLFQAFSVTIPMVLIAAFAGNRLETFHGLKSTELWPYFVLLLGAGVVVAVASTQTDFQNYYPRFAKMWPEGGDWQWERIAAFEFSYALDFFATEYFFRGFLVLAFARYLGPQAILPMAILYVTIHYGKPLGETISSFFGGMLLGVFAYYSKSIWGGIIVHIGLAFLMELTIFL